MLEKALTLGDQTNTPLASHPSSSSTYWFSPIYMTVKIFHTIFITQTLLQNIHHKTSTCEISTVSIKKLKHLGNYVILLVYKTLKLEREYVKVQEPQWLSKAYVIWPLFSIQQCKDMCSYIHPFQATKPVHTHVHIHTYMHTQA